MSYIPQVSRDPKVLRPAAILTNALVTSLALKTQNWNQVVLYLDATLGSLTDIRVRIQVASPIPNQVLDVEPSAGSTDWYDLSFQNSGAATTLAGVSSVPVTTFEIVLSASGRYAIPLPVNYQWVRVSALGTGTLTGSSLAVRATTGMA